ncbi:hypothetical protein SNOG_13914 [Parastagonospora nodorum SN15]|nr:hypothetical protein SNOG_13914 [Parastagonospora nodorum SN15]EAT78539.1 hypothetical protein SNOG_13914 [Parastagonospora nodorum SN15]
MSQPLPKLIARERQIRSENVAYIREPFDNIETESILDLRKDYRNWPDLTGEKSDFSIVQYQKKPSCNRAANTWRSGIGITTNSEHVLEALQAGWVVRNYKFFEGERDARLEALHNKCSTDTVNFGAWTYSGVEGKEHVGATEHLLCALELDSDTRAKRASAPGKYFDGKSSERVLQLNASDRFIEGMLKTYADGDAWLVKYDTILFDITDDGYAIPRSGLGITTSRDFAKRVHSNPGWAMRVYKFTNKERAEKWHQIASHCISQPENFGSWESDPGGNAGSWIGTSSFLKDAADIAGAAPAAVGDAQRKPSNKAAGKLPFDPTTDETPQPT